MKGERVGPARGGRDDQTHSADDAQLMKKRRSIESCFSTDIFHDHGFIDRQGLASL